MYIFINDKTAVAAGSDWCGLVSLDFFSTNYSPWCMTIKDTKSEVRGHFKGPKVVPGHSVLLHHV